MSLLGTRAMGEQMPEEDRKKIFSQQKLYHTIFNKWRDLDFLTTSLSMVGLILAIINFEHDTTISEDAIDMKMWPDPMAHPRNTN